MNMKHLNKFILTIFILTALISCNGQNNDTSLLPHITKKESNSISNKKDKKIYYGSIVTHITEGEYELNKMLANENSPLSNQEKFELSIAILQNNSLYHLHKRAGAEISGVIDTIEIPQLLKSINQDRLNYILLMANVRLGQMPLSGINFDELDKEKIDELINVISKEIIEYDIRKYFIEALYAMVMFQRDGRVINTRLKEIGLNNDLNSYNDSLFTTFKAYKPEFEKLDAIPTWMEMDKNYDAIKEMFENSHPIMFLQLLYFNPSTVLESKELCVLKQKALLDIMSKADNNSFYETYRLVYLNELLVDRNYSVRFLDQLMNRKEKREFIRKLEENRFAER